MILDAIKNIIGTYNKRGFTIQNVLADPEFEALRNDLKNTYGINLNTALAGEHVPEIERCIQTIKER